METFVVCTSCACLVKAFERACPFCAAPREHAPPTAHRALPRMSRGTWLAFGSLAIAGCSGAVVPPSDIGDAGSTASTPARQGSDAAADATARVSDASLIPVDASGCSFDRAATFACGAGVTCNRATEYCALTAGSHEPTGCVADNGYPFPPECLGCPTIDCLRAHDTGNCIAMEIDDGAGIGLACGGCYGSPPARLERLRRAVT